MAKIAQKAVWIGATLVALTLVSAILFDWGYLHGENGATRVAEIGGPFSLVGYHGKSVTDRDYLCKPTLVFFWFTHCPNLCPSPLLEIIHQLKKFGQRAAPLKF